MSDAFDAAPVKAASRALAAAFALLAVAVLVAGVPPAPVRFGPAAGPPALALLVVARLLAAGRAPADVVLAVAAVPLLLWSAWTLPGGGAADALAGGLALSVAVLADAVVERFAAGADGGT